MHEIKEGLRGGRVEVIDADISGYFDAIPHDKLLALVARRVSDGTLLALIKAWLKAPIIEIDPKTKKRKITPNDRGTPQGGVISPLLANLYLDGLDKAVNERCELKPKMIRYADDFVILCGRGQGQGLKERVKRWLTARGLTLNEKKTRLLNSRADNFRFLGFQVGWRTGRSGRQYVHVEPHAKSRLKLREKMREKLNHWTISEPVEEQVRRVNRTLKGWAGYFRWGNYWKVFGRMQHAVNNRVRRWLWRKHDCTRGLYSYYTDARLHGLYGLIRIVPMETPKANR
jgi:group II intron reverse transcriptase/maturase